MIYEGQGANRATRRVIVVYLYDWRFASGIKRMSRAIQVCVL